MAKVIYDSDNGKTFQFAVSDQFTVTLDAIAPETWRLVWYFNSAVRPSNYSILSNAGINAHEFEFDAVQIGTHTLNFELVNPYLPAPPRQLFSVTVTVI